MSERLASREHEGERPELAEIVQHRRPLFDGERPDIAVPGVVAEHAAPVAAVGELEMGAERLGEVEGPPLDAQPAPGGRSSAHSASMTRPRSRIATRNSCTSRLAVSGLTSNRRATSPA